MVDVNKQINKLLSPLRKEEIRVCYQYPDSFMRLPAVSYYDLNTSECFKADNVEQTQLSSVQIDIWADREAQPGEIAGRINKILQKDGWARELKRDLPRGAENHVYHTTMRYAKEICCGE